MLREHFHHTRLVHERTVLRIGLFILLVCTIGIAGWFGMNPTGIAALAVLFLLAWMGIEAMMGHY